jgi:hypothetical protein
MKATKRGKVNEKNEVGDMFLGVQTLVWAFNIQLPTTGKKT